MNEFTKGVVVMAGFIGSAISMFLKENDELLEGAKVLGGLAACRIVRSEESRDVNTGIRTFRWSIEFRDDEDLEMFNDAVRKIVAHVTGEGM